jgi:peptidoglycan/LPS O-acetylase OafA/YrhL
MLVETNPAARHIPALDGLRALAITGVIFCHINNTWDWEQVAQGPLSCRSRCCARAWGLRADGAGRSVRRVHSLFLTESLLVQSAGHGSLAQQHLCR